MNDTKKSSRRTLRLDSYDDLVAEAERLVSINAEGTGNWTLGEVIDHVAIGIAKSMTGVDVKVALPMRIMGRLMLGRMLKKGFPAGIQTSADVSKVFSPEPGVSADVALQRLRDASASAKVADAFVPSAMFGQMKREQWEQFQCRHAELHFSFFDVS